MVVLNSKRIVVADRQNSSANCWYCRGNRVIGEILFDLCQDCSKMPSIPQGAFAACKMREQLKQDMTVARFQSGEKQEPRKDFNNKKLMEYTPVKYNSKLMNSIWGLYNRYSPHNIKGVDEEAARSQSFLQQPETVAYAIANKISMAPGKEWNFSGKK